MRRPRCGGLMVREKSEDSRRESDGDEFSGGRNINCGAISDSVRAAHRCIASSAVVSTQAFTTRHTSFSFLTIRSKAAQGRSMGIWLSLLHDAFT
jgi:hypothetical protein